MSKTIKPKDIKEGKLERKDWIIWIVISIIYIFGIAILSGTIEYYLGTEELAYGLYVDWSLFFLLIGISLWFVVTMFVIAMRNKRTKGKKKKTVRKKK